MAKRKRITIQIIGADKKEDIRLSDFLEKLKSIKKALRETEITISGNDEPTIDYRLVDLRHASPYTIVLEPVALNGTPAPDLIPEVVHSFESELRLIKSRGELLIEPELARLEAYQDIAQIQPGRIEGIRIRVGNKVVTMDSKFNKNLDSIVGPDEFSDGAISGMLEALNFHNTNKFTLYPPLGPKRVAGTFRPKDRPQIKEALGSFVTIFGKLRYKAWSPYPHGVLADKIDVHEPDSELPTLTELRGAFKGCTGELNSAEFVDQLRHDDW